LLTSTESVQGAETGAVYGRRVNSIVKDWANPFDTAQDRPSIRVALIYPDSYEIGMSNMALPILYELLNRQPDVLAERAFAPGRTWRRS